MNINSVNNSFCAVQGHKNSSINSVPSFSCQKAQNIEGTESVYSRGKISIAFASLAKIFQTHNKSEEETAKELVPYVLDAACYRAGIINPKQVALTYRYGNAQISEAEPEIIEKVKSNLQKMGINEINENNLKLFRVADGDKERFVYKRFSYYDETDKKSIIFSQNGEMDYKVAYMFSAKGEILDYYHTDIHNPDIWTVL